MLTNICKHLIFLIFNLSWLKLESEVAFKLLLRHLQQVGFASTVEKWMIVEVLTIY